MLKYIELKLGRENIYNKKYEDRIIDIDIIYYQNIKFCNEELIIPHVLHTKKRNFSKKILKDLDNIC